MSLHKLVTISLDAGETMITIRADGRITWSPPHRPREWIVDSLGYRARRLYEELDLIQFALDAIREGRPRVNLLFGSRLKMARIRHHLTQKTLAARAHVTAAAISQIEHGKRKPAFGTIVALAQALGTTPNDLMGFAATALREPSLTGVEREG